MRQFILAITALFGMTLWAQTDVQFQAHVPFQATDITCNVNNELPLVEADQVIPSVEYAAVFVP